MKINTRQLINVIRNLPRPTRGAIEVVKIRDRVDELDNRVPDYYENSPTAVVAKTFNETELVFKAVAFHNTAYDGSLIFEWELEICT